MTMTELGEHYEWRLSGRHYKGKRYKAQGEYSGTSRRLIIDVFDLHGEGELHGLNSQSYDN